MRKLRRLRPSPAMVVAMIALFVAIGGVSWAAATVGTNDIKDGAVTTDKIRNKAVARKKLDTDSVNSNKIKANAVKTEEIADQAVTTGKIADQAVTTDKIADLAVTTGKIADQAVSTDKIADQAVANGKIADLAVTTGKLGGDSVTAPKLANTQDGLTTVNLAANSTTNVTATCPAGGQALSGGYFTPPSGVVQVTRTRRDSDNTWVFTFRNTAGTGQGVDARVTCLVG